MKKITCLLLSLIMLFIFAFTSSTSTVKAIDSSTYKNKTHQNCTKVKIKQYYSYNQCKKIVKEAKKYKSATSYAKKILNLSNSGAKIPLKIFLADFNASCKQIKNFFQKAVNKKKGVEFSYTYHITNNNATHHATNFTKKYK